MWNIYIDNSVMDSFEFFVPDFLVFSLLFHWCVHPIRNLASPKKETIFPQSGFRVGFYKFSRVLFVFNGEIKIHYRYKSVLADHYPFL